MKVLLIAIVAALVLGVGGAGYTGLLPGVSDVMGTSKARDLGVQYTKANNDSYNEKAKATIEVGSKEAENTQYGIAFADFEEIDTTFTEQELTARLNNIEYPYWFANNTQVKIGQKGQIEVSSNVNIDKFVNFLGVVGVSPQVISSAQEGLSKIGMFSKNPPVYINANAKVVDNVAVVDIQSAQIGRIPLPIDKFDADGAVSGLANLILSKAPKFYAEKVEFDNGQMLFVGTAPTKIMLP